MVSQKLNVHFMPGDGKGWALDEDQRQMRLALRGVVRESSLAQAEIIHTPFWQGLSGVAPEILKQCFVIANADNPPFFYLKQPDFSWGQQVVNLWIARSQEALEQFRALKLPVEYIPYTIDSELFFPISDKKTLRKRFGIPESAYVIANFHRDSEGGNLNTPKVQKAPELFLAILKELRQRGYSFHVLLAGPRRHWLRAALVQEGISFTFVGKQDISGDDFGINILKRATLNELINAADLYLIPSRWEGGPQSVMEAAACRCKILSTPLGVAKDILEPASLYRSVEEAVDRIVKDQESDFLQSTVQPQWEKWHCSHTTATLQEGLQGLYKRLPERLPQRRKRASTMISYRHQALHVLWRWFRRGGAKSPVRSIGWNHEIGKDSDLDNILLNVSSALRDWGVKQHPAKGSGLEIIGWPSEKLPPVKKGVQRLQWILPQMGKEHFLPEALLVAPSVQDVLNLRAAGCFQSAVVLPWPIASAKSLSENLSSKSTDAANNCVAPVLASSSIDYTLSRCASSTPCSSSTSATFKTGSEEPLVVAQDDHFASLDIWKAMSAGRPIVYSSNSAYYEQVFHAGLSFQSEEELPLMIQNAREKALEFRALAKILTVQEARERFKQLLSILNCGK
ncbi:MAG: glycosyltransferase family 4 protein [Chthoniobacterales bacterium]|nr:glycosyltransferase family 4 protein [Chthoniobacterales bacterium]